MTTSPFTPTVTAKIQQQRIMARQPAPTLRDGPVPERFKAIKRHWNKALGNNDGYDLWDLSGEKTTFEGEQPLLDAYLAGNPLPQGAHGIPRQIDLFVHWGHDSKGKHVITEVQPVPVPLAPPSDETIERLKHDEHVQTHQGVAMTGQSELTAAFPRTADNQPAPDDEGLALADYLIKKAAEPPKPAVAPSIVEKAKRPAQSEWVADNEKLGKFWGKIHKLELEFGWEPKDVEALVYKCAGVEHLHDYVGTANDLFLAVNEAMLDKQRPPEDSNAQNSPNEAIGEAKVKSEATTPETTNGPIAPENATANLPNEKVADKSKPEHKKILEFTPHPLLDEIKTLQGVPASKIRSVLNRGHVKKAYREIEGKRPGEVWTDLKPIAVRRRLDRVFGPQGLGWRIVPIPGVGKVVYQETIEHVQEKVDNKTGKVIRTAYDRTLHVVSLEGFTLEYALVGPDGKLTYVQTSAISDSDKNDDRGYAYRGAVTSLMKHALRLLGGFDHFADKWYDESLPIQDEAA